MTTADDHRRLDELGDALLAATTRNRPRRRRSVAVALAATAIALPGAAFAASALTSEEEVASGLPSAIAVLAGSEPTCETVRPNLEYYCVLANPPQEGDIPPGAWKNVLEPIVDATKHVSGGCRSLEADGTRWRCYVGEEAIRRELISPEFMGEYLPNPVKG